MILDEFKSMVKSCLQDDEKAPDVKSGAFLLSFSPRYEDVLIQKKEQFLAELETYKKSLIYEYVTGKKEV